MSPPSSLLVSRYRAFAGDEVLPLRPLTLLYGRNNSGKSALARALGIIGASVAEDAARALVFPPEILRDGSFADVAWQGDAGDYSFDLALGWDEGELREARYTLDGGPGRAAFVKELFLKGEAGKLLWSGIAPADRPMQPQIGHEGGELHFVGMIPQESAVPAVRALAERMRALRGRVRWLDGVRARPERNVKRTGTLPRHASDGSDAVPILIERPDLVSDVGRFYAELDPPRELEVKEELDIGYRIRLNSKSQASFRIDLVDTGEGMAQVLPVLVKAVMAAREGLGSLLVMEEPESHLHLDAQTVLARFLCAIAAGQTPPTLMLETHSRVFLLGVQLAVAEGRLPHDRVGLAWIDQDAQGRSHITPVELLPSGHPREGWPVAALGEDLRLAGELARVDMKRRH